MPGSIKIDDGSGNYTILTNAGSLGSDKTLTIPNETATLATTNGITNAEMWILTADFTGDAAPIASNWSRHTNATKGAGYFGSAITESSGIFTFPSTGYWYIIFNHFFRSENGYDVDYSTARIQVTLDNSSYTLAAESIGHTNDTAQTSNNYSTTSTHYIFDVTDTSLCKVRFDVSTSNTSRNITEGDTTRFFTGLLFQRLGDT